MSKRYESYIDVPVALYDSIDDYITAFHPSNIPLLLKGGPGVGKTRASVARLKVGLAAQYGVEESQIGVVVLHLCSQPAEDVGSMMIPKVVEKEISSTSGQRVKTKAAVCVYSVPGVINAVEELVAAGCQVGVIILDEFLQAPMDTQKAAMQLVREGRINQFALPANWGRLLLSNREQDNCGVNEPMAHFLNGIGSYEVFTPLRDLIPHWEDRGMDSLFRGFIKFDSPDDSEMSPGSFEQDVPDTPRQFFTPRSYEYAHDLVRRALGDEQITGESANLRIALRTAQGRARIRRIVASTCGPVCMGFMAYLKHAENLLPFEECMRRSLAGETVPITGPELSCAYQAMMISHSAPEQAAQNSEGICKFIDQSLGTAFQYATYMACIRKSQARIQKHPAWTKFVRDHIEEIEMITSVRGVSSRDAKGRIKKAQ